MHYSPEESLRRTRISREAGGGWGAAAPQRNKPARPRAAANETSFGCGTQAAQRKSSHWFLYALLCAHAACVEDAPSGPSADDLAAARKDLLPAAPTPRYPVHADLGGKVIYLGLDVDPPAIVPSRKFTLTHYFKVVEPPGDWKLFTHLHGAGKSHFTNLDHTPVQGKYPVSAWRAGDIVRDVQEVTLEPGFKSNVVEIYLGLWRGDERMPILKGPDDGEKRVKAASIPVAGAEPPAPVAGPRRYVVRRIKDGLIKVDGKTSEAAWADAAIAGPFVDTMTGAPAEQKTTARLLYDSKFLYVAFDNEDTDVWTTLTRRDDKLWTQEVDELMIDADGDGKTYVELQVNPAGTVFDTYLPVYRQREDAFDAEMKVAVTVQGTLDKRGDTDKGWTAELAIPLAKVVKPKPGFLPSAPRSVPPKPGEAWRANLYRMDWPGGPAGGRQTGWGWSPPLVGDFHKLDRFGVLAFADEKGQVPEPGPAGAAGGGGASAQSGTGGGEVASHSGPLPPGMAPRGPKAPQGIMPALNLPKQEGSKKPRKQRAE